MRESEVGVNYRTSGLLLYGVGLWEKVTLVGFSLRMCLVSLL